MGLLGLWCYLSIWISFTWNFFSFSTNSLVFGPGMSVLMTGPWGSAPCFELQLYSKSTFLVYYFRKHIFYYWLYLQLGCLVVLVCEWSIHGSICWRITENLENLLRKWLIMGGRNDTINVVSAIKCHFITNYTGCWKKGKRIVGI